MSRIEAAHHATCEVAMRSRAVAFAVVGLALIAGVQSDSEEDVAIAEELAFGASGMRPR